MDKLRTIGKIGIAILSGFMGFLGGTAIAYSQTNDLELMKQLSSNEIIYEGEIVSNEYTGLELVYKIDKDVFEQTDKFNLSSRTSLSYSIANTEHKSVEYKVRDSGMGVDKEFSHEAMLAGAEDEMNIMYSKVDKIGRNRTREMMYMNEIYDIADEEVPLSDNVGNMVGIHELPAPVSATEPTQTSEVVEEAVIIKTDIQMDALLGITNPDPNYTGVVMQISADERSLLERLVMGEAGGEGFEGAALVAQCIRDTMVYDNVNSVDTVRINYKYSGNLNKEPNQSVLDAVAYIFDQGGIAVKHRIQYFYAPRLCKASWHETQNFVIEYKGHRFFARW